MSSPDPAKAGLKASLAKRRCHVFIPAAAVLLLAQVCALAADKPVAPEKPQTESPAAPGKLQEGGLPPYEFGYTNPLYATLAGFLSIKDLELKGQNSYKLEIKSFRKKMPVKAILQPHEAPLVVVLLGVDGKADSPLGKLWVSWYAEAGYHVLTFDSTFRPSFVEISGHGASGNLKADAEQVKDILAAFLDLSEVHGKVQKFGIVGMSYGGLQALMLGQMAQQGHLPFKIDALQAYSPPVNIAKTGELLDRWYNEDRWNYTLVQLADKLADHKPVGPDKPVPFDDSLMRAGIAALFRLNLADVILRNDIYFKLHKLPSGDEFDDQYIKEEYAKTWGYQRFMEDMAFPYWQQKAGLKNLSDMMGPAELAHLLENQLPCAQVILSEDDPFNTAEDMAGFKAAAAKKNVLFLPRGGHLGYVNEPWTKAKLLTLFRRPEPQASSAK
ncbi:MAG: alpha/beta fold hydrolase [Planctomycetota bacterium]